MIRLVFLISSLQRGGAEKQLTLLIRHLDHTKFHVSVVTTYAPGDLSQDLADIPNVQVLSVNKQGMSDSLAAVARISRLVRSLRPDVVHGYMDTGNLMATIAGRMSGARVVWGIRSSDLAVVPEDPATKVYRQLAIGTSRLADLIIANSEAGKAWALDRGYPASGVAVIPNGFDTAQFCPAPERRAQVRRGWGVNDDAPLIGIVARLTPIKDHPTFLRAAALVVREYPAAKFVCAGRGFPAEEAMLRELATSLGVADHVLWVGEQTDMPAVYNALDLVVSTSISEGFSNALGEAMACGRTCIATDVGDARTIIGDTGEVIQVGDAPALAAAILTFLAQSPEEQQRQREEACAHIVEEYSVELLATRTAAALTRLLPRHRQGH